ncbi:hypothetical protein ASG14_09280 [Pedobacter sp. Leaf194]|nr:hypothetical protein ASG14_09280 [Pedobacter sp. Leaf194]
MDYHDILLLVTEVKLFQFNLWDEKNKIKLRTDKRLSLLVYLILAHRNASELSQLQQLYLQIINCQALF